MIATNLFVIPDDGKPQLARFVYGAPVYLEHIQSAGARSDTTMDALFDPRRGILVQIHLVGDVAFLLPVSAASMSSN